MVERGHEVRRDPESKGRPPIPTLVRGVGRKKSTDKNPILLALSVPKQLIHDTDTRRHYLSQT